MKLRPYQEESIKLIFEKFKTKNKVLYTLPTGGGKTFCFSWITKEFVKNTGKKVLILCHLEELIDQAVNTLNSLGVSSQKIVASTKRAHYFTDSYVAMVETINNRLKKNNNYIDDIGLIIADECHIQVFQKVFEYFPNAKILGVTATPSLLGKETFYKCNYCHNTNDHSQELCCNHEMEEWTRPRKLSDVYEDIVVGATISHLIEIGSLVPEMSFVRSTDISGLKVDSSGEYTTRSLDNVFASETGAFNCYLNYMELAKGKRTLVFNASTKANLIIYEQFKSKGVNVKMYDSVNKNEESRKEIIEWFKSTPDAVLLNVATFVAGLDVREIECIILNMATKSLNKFIQICGRGSRPSDKIFKDSFIIIDGGENIAEFGEWSSDRDWEDIFWNGIGKPRAKKMEPEDVQDCPECGALFPKREVVCSVCLKEMEVPDIIPKNRVEVESKEILRPIREIPPPSGVHIYNYTIQQGENISFAHRILQNRIVDMFRYYNVTKDKYESAKKSGELDEKVKKMILKPYFYLMKKEDIQSGSKRTLEYLIEKTKHKIESYYSNFK